MQRKTWIRIVAIVLALLLLWWLYWAILINEDGKEESSNPANQIEAIQ